MICVRGYVARKKKQLKPIAVDEDGFPVVFPEGRLDSRDDLPKGVCPICFDISGKATVTMTRYGFAALFCKACKTRVFINSPGGHEMLRRSTKLLRRNPQLRALLIEEATASD